MTAPLVTLLTDYGVGSLYVGLLHGVIARICPEAQVIDVAHDLPRGDVVAGAIALLDAAPFLPTGIHVAVVDPGVGSLRRAVAFRTADGQRFVGPDNGLLSLAAKAVGGVREAVEISESPFRLQPVSATFHGRDLFAPVAAALAAGAPFPGAGVPFPPGELIELRLPEPKRSGGAVEMVIATVDSFGNLGLWARPEDVPGLAPGGRVAVQTGRLTVEAVYGATFSDVGPGALLLHPDSTGRLALAVNRGSAADALLDVSRGAPVWLAPLDPAAGR